MEGPKYPEIEVQLIGLDGNAGSIIARVVGALRESDEVPQIEYTNFRREAMSGSYDDLLRTVMRWVNVY